MKTLLAICQQSREPNISEVTDPFFISISTFGSFKSPFENNIGLVSFTLVTEDLFYWFYWFNLIIRRRSATSTTPIPVSSRWQVPSKHFNVASRLSFGWYDVPKWDNVKSRLQQCCVFQHWNLQCRTTSNHRCVFQRWYKQS